jgi:DNA repair protein RadC
VQTGSDEQNHGGLKNELIKEKLETFVRATGAFRASRVTDRLVEECGAPALVFGAPKHRIERAVGGRSNVGLALRTARWLSLHCFEERAQYRPIMRSRRALVSYLANAMAQDDRETVRILYTQTDLTLIKVEVAHKGSRHSCDIDPRYVLRRALDLGAAGMILVHNHPSGNPMPSAEDFLLTSRIAALCREFDVHLIDHIVIGIHGAKSAILERGEDSDFLD